MDFLLQLAGRDFFQPVGECSERIGNRSIQDYIRSGYGEGGARHAEFKFIAGKGKRGGPVPVGRILYKVGQHFRTGGHGNRLLCLRFGICLNNIKDRGQIVADEHGNDGRRSLIAA